MFTTAQRQFEKDLAKRQREGWRLVSVTPTNSTFSRISQLTAIYVRDHPHNENMPLDIPYSYLSNPQKQIPPQPAKAPPSPSYLWEQTPSSAATPPYSKTIFLGLIIMAVLSIMLIGLGGASTGMTDRFLLFISRAGASLFMGVLIGIFIMDWKGFVSLEGLIKWRQMEDKKRIGMGCLFFFFFPIFFFIYLIRAGLNVFQLEGPVFSKAWDAPRLIKRRAKIGLIAGTAIAVISLAFSASGYSTGANVEDVSMDISPTTVATVVVNTSNSTLSPAVTATSRPKPSPTATATPPVKPTPTAVPYAQFGDGTYVVGTDIQPGTYRTRVASSNCYYARLRGFGGTIDDIIANNNTEAPTVITISSSDKGFESSSCGTWTKE